MTAPHPVLRRIGQLLSALVALALFADGATGLFAPAKLASEMAASGWPLQLAPVIGGITLACAILYAIPRLAVLGAILVTGFLGGAICTHLRLGEVGSPPQLICIALGAMTWGGLYLRDERLRRLLPYAL